MNLLSVDTLTKSLGQRVLFKELTFGLAQGEKAALIGQNGSGKTTMLQIIAGREDADSGIVAFRKDLRVGYLDQNPQFPQGLNALEAIFNSGNPTLKLLRDYEKALILSTEDHEKGAVELDRLMQEMDRLNAWDLESKVRQILGQMGIYDLQQPLASMSGGQKKRVALAKVLLEEPELLLLDEPTNHLDLEVIEWLEGYLSSQKITLLMVTHDRYFLDQVCNVIFELDGGQLFRVDGPYTKFLELKDLREQVTHQEVEKARNLMRKELDWIRRQPKARGTKAKYRVEAFEDLKEKASQNLKKDLIQLDTKLTRQGSKILELHHINKSWGDRCILSNFSHVFQKGERIGVVGANGAGKSTLLQLLSGQLSPDSGVIDKGNNTVFGYYRQQELTASPGTRVIDIVTKVAEYISLSDGSQISASQLLNRFLFPPKQQYDLVEKLSGGEKRRLQLLQVLMLNPNFILLDEPTNDLDIQTLNILEDFLEQYQGCLMVVSHDRYFMDRLVDHLWVFEGEGKLVDFPGNYTDYRESGRQRVSFTQETKPVVQEVPPARQKRKLSFAEQQELEQLEKKLPELEKRMEKLSEQMSAGEGSASDFAEWSSQYALLKDELAQAEIRWLELIDIKG
jgi:ABC transport system ATP-binding/permease protein